MSYILNIFLIDIYKYILYDLKRDSITFNKSDVDALFSKVKQSPLTVILPSQALLLHMCICGSLCTTVKHFENIKLNIIIQM